MIFNHNRQLFVTVITVHTQKQCFPLFNTFHPVDGLGFQCQHSIWEATVKQTHIIYAVYVMHLVTFQ